MIFFYFEKSLILKIEYKMSDKRIYLYLKKHTVTACVQN